MSLLGDIVVNLVKGAVAKSTAGFITKYQLTPAQGTELNEGIMVEIQLALDIFNDSQSKGTTS